MVECLTQDRGATGSSLTGDCVVSLIKIIDPSLVLVQPRKTRPIITGRLLMGRKESDKTNKKRFENDLAQMVLGWPSTKIAKINLIC